MTRDRQRAATAGLLALGIGAFAAGKWRARRRRDENDGFVEVEIHE